MTLRDLYDYMVRYYPRSSLPLIFAYLAKIEEGDLGMGTAKRLANFALNHSG